MHDHVVPDSINWHILELKNMYVQKSLDPCYSLRLTPSEISQALKYDLVPTMAAQLDDIQFTAI